MDQMLNMIDESITTDGKIKSRKNCDWNESGENDF